MSLRATLKSWTQGRYALPAAALIGFLENTIILFALEPLFLPLMAARGKGAWKVAAALLIGNIIGGIVLYFFGMWAAEAVITPFVEWIGAAETYEETALNIEENGFVALFLVGVTPLPFQVGAVAAGAVSMAVIPFLIAMTISRAIRYFAESLLVMAIGQRAEDWINNHELELFIGGFVVLGGVVVVSVLL